ncbi:hypothetical protein Tco_1091738 [Tanacetum coccineum]|uniref:Uncharacterized protein n=1 Tax=Tanacetum coccineum TaxID=301880 RepID=A0ABQ5I835_9ASTR
MAPNIRSVVVPLNNGASSSSNNNSMDDTVRQAIGEIVDEKLASIQQVLADLSSQVLGISLQNQKMENGLGVQITLRIMEVLLVEKFKQVVLARFGSVFDDPMVELKILKYETSDKIYEDAFDTLLSRVEISEDHVVSLFMGALGWLLEEIHVTWAHLEKKWTRLQLYIKSLEEYAYSAWRRCHILL